MDNFSILLYTLLIISACTCGAKTECSEQPKLSIVMKLNKLMCEEISHKPHLFKESDNYAVQNLNISYAGLKIETLFIHICGSNLETLKAIFKTIIWANIDCLRAPYFLGFVGPNDAENLKVALKITSALKIPHITGFSSSSSYVHQVSQKEDDLIIKGILKLLEILEWESFSVDINNRSDNQYLAKRFVEEATAKNLCLSSIDDDSPYIIYFGEPDHNYLHNLQNATVIIISTENLDNRIKDFHSSNSFLLLDNLRSGPRKLNISTEPELYNSNTLELQSAIRADNLILDAMHIYTEALISCRKNNCYAYANADNWNKLLTETVISYNDKNKSERKMLIFKLKNQREVMTAKGRLNIYRSDIQLYWNNRYISNGELKKDNNTVDLRNFIMKKKVHHNCTVKRSNLNILDIEKPIDKYKSTPVKVSEMTESEWWTMVATVAAVGMTMFVIGFFAVYVIYTNIRGSRSSKDSDFNRDSSLRRIGSDRQEALGSSRNTRVTSGLQRRDSRSSIKSTISNKSV